MTTKARLYELVDQLQNDDLPVVERLLEGLLVSADSAMRTLSTALPDDETETPEERDAVAAARKDIESGRVTSHDAVLSEFRR